MAGLPWIKVWTVVGSHPKVQRLEKALGVKDALGVVVRLWCWTADYSPSGEIPEADGLAAAKAARGEATRRAAADVLAALVACDLLDRTPGAYRVHDWQDMQTVHVEAEEKRKALAAERQARYRERHGNALRNPSRNGHVTEEGVTKKEKEKETREDQTNQPEESDAGRLVGQEWMLSFRSELGLRIGLGRPLGIGNNARVLPVFEKHMAAVGSAVLLADCEAIARQSNKGTPVTLSFFVDWLENLPVPPEARQ